MYLALVTACVFLLFLLAYYPGVISVDGYQQYYQAVNFRFDDWHPPIMSALWGLLDKIARGSQGMFLLQIVMAVYSAYLLSRTALSKQKKFWFIPVLALLLPVVCNLLFVIWKDVSLTVSLFFAFSTWYSWRASGKLTKPRLALILAAIFYGSAVRHNALPATIPLLFIILLDYVSARKALALAVLCSGLFYMGNSFIVYRILNAGKSHFFQIVVNHDLMGIYEITKKNYFPENTLSKTQLDKLMQKFDHSNLDPTTFSEDSFSTSDPEIQSALRKRWLTAIMENPSAYLKHRWILYRDFLTKIVFILIPYSGPPPENVSDMPKPCMEEGFLARTNHAYVYWARYHYGFVYKTITYLIVSTVILIYSIRRKLVTPAALSASSLLYIAPYFFVAPAVNYRYIYWSVFATILSLIVLWIENYGEGRPVESH